MAVRDTLDLLDAEGRALPLSEATTPQVSPVLVVVGVAVFD